MVLRHLSSETPPWYPQLNLLLSSVRCQFSLGVTLVYWLHHLKIALNILKAKSKTGSWYVDAWKNLWLAELLEDTPREVWGWQQALEHCHSVITHEPLREDIQWQRRSSGPESGSSRDGHPGLLPSWTVTHPTSLSGWGRSTGQLDQSQQTTACWPNLSLSLYPMVKYGSFLFFYCLFAVTQDPHSEGACPRDSMHYGVCLKLLVTYLVFTFLKKSQMGQ